VFVGVATCTHSERSAITGSTLDARRAGPKPATNPMMRNAAPTIANVVGSLSEIPNINDRNDRDANTASGSPIAVPNPWPSGSGRPITQFTVLGRTKQMMAGI
jgi:hypothetical protein